MREIPLTRGLVALVDDEDYERVNDCKWYATPGHNTFYAQRRGPRDAQGKRATLSMHRLVLDMPVYEPGGLEVDHIDRDGLNNTRANLRPVTHAGNAANRIDVRWLADRACAGCGVVFHPAKSTTRFCSRHCFGVTAGAANLVAARAARWCGGRL